MIVKCYAEPSLEPVTKAELEVHLGISSGTVATDMTPYTSIASGSQTVAPALTGTAVEVLGHTAIVYLTPINDGVIGTVDVKITECDTLAGTYTDWATGAFTQVANNGMTTSPALAIGTTLQNVANGVFTFYIGTTAYPKAADETAFSAETVPINKFGAVAFDIAANGTITPVSATGNAAGYDTAVLAIAGIPAHDAAKARMGTVTAKSTITGGFVFGTTPLNLTGTTVAYTSALNVTDSVIYEKAYTGSKKYIKTVAKILEATCEFGTSVMVWEPNVSEDDMLNEIISASTDSLENDTSKKIMRQTWDYFPQKWPDGDRLKIPFGNLWSLLSLTIVDSSCVESDGVHALIFTGTNTTPATGTYTVASNVITAATITGGGAGYVTAPTVATISGDGSVTAALVSVTWKDTAGTVTTMTAGTDYLVESNGDQCGFIVLPYGGSWPSSSPLYPSNPISIRFVCGWATAAEVPSTIKQAIKRWCVNNYMNRGDDVIGQTVSRDVTYERLVNLAGRLFDMDFA